MLNENLLVEKGMMNIDFNGDYNMKPIDDLMEESSMKSHANVLYLFEVRSWDFGLEDEEM
jgi:hypothetical protein